jgi:Mrp family chromosome partitioning ATPase
MKQKGPKQKGPNKGAKRSKRRGADGHLTLYDRNGEIVHVAPATVSESLRYMLARTRLRDGGELPERVGVTSAISGEGVTFVTRSLALVLANDVGRRVCIVDLNWGAPARWPGNEESGGMADLLRRVLPLDDAIVATGNPGLDIIPAGSASVTERPLLANSPDLDKILVSLSESYDHVLLDLPAVHATSETLTLAEASRSVALVVNQGVTPEAQVKSALDELGGVNVLGVVLNRTSTKVPRAIRRRLSEV